ncbi:MAG: hypothetical protein ACRCXZ_06225 [Patescibacteria group bacterium]
MKRKTNESRLTFEKRLIAFKNRIYLGKFGAVFKPHLKTLEMKLAEQLL